ncbi:MAG: hypothetical protein CM15mP39_04650 [Synechococcus sp.]|nr:MAG: hypothetical protein CM15mP39_04650 [Synechococcus sp.]
MQGSNPHRAAPLGGKAQKSYQPAQDLGELPIKASFEVDEALTIHFECFLMIDTHTANRGNLDRWIQTKLSEIDDWVTAICACKLQSQDFSAGQS